VTITNKYDALYKCVQSIGSDAQALGKVVEGSTAVGDIVLKCYALLANIAKPLNINVPQASTKDDIVRECGAINDSTPMKAKLDLTRILASYKFCLQNETAKKLFDGK